jgi:hypothetical protein
MKPTLLYIAILVVIACAAFTSCEQKSNQSPAHVDSLSIQYSWDCSRELMDYVDIEITYANSNGELVTDTLTRDNISSLSLGIQDYDGLWYYDSTSTVSWHEDIVIDTIPARLYLKARYLIKPGIEVDKDKMIRIGSSMSIQNTTEFSEYSDSIPEPEFELRDYYRVTFCPIHSVRGNKLKAYLELANEEASTLDYTVQRRASDPSIGEFVKND